MDGRALGLAAVVVDVNQSVESFVSVSLRIGEPGKSLISARSPLSDDIFCPDLRIGESGDACVGICLRLAKFIDPRLMSVHSPICAASEFSEHLE